MSHLRFDASDFAWEGVQRRPYKEHGSDFRGIVRQTLARGSELSAAFELRYFELEPHGYSSLEKHQHVHFVVALRGRGRALVGEQVFLVEPFDAVYVPPLMAHRFLTEGDRPFGFLCPVDAERDHPAALDETERAALRANPVTAPYAF